MKHATGIWFGFTNVLFRAVVALYHVNDVLKVTVDVMSYIRCDEWSDFTCRVECVYLSLTTVEEEGRNIGNKNIYSGP